MTDNNEVIKKRVQVRETTFSDPVLDEYVTTAVDRILLYTGLSNFPVAFNSIAVEVILSMYRRKYHEGISSENVDVMSISFVENLLSQYDREFSNYKTTWSDDESETTGGKLVFR